MRYIDTKELYKKVNTWSGVELWKNEALKKDFGECSFNKCWYTECLLIGQDIQIDHFRPKAKIVEFPNYPYNTTIADTGYDWLANDYQNYRACCIHANRKTGDGGKSNYFPLKPGSPHAYAGQMNGEEGMLIDPLVKTDVQLLSFFKNRIDCTSSDHYEKARVEVSKVIYNLINTGLTDERLKKWNKVTQFIDYFVNNKIAKEVLLKYLSEESDRKSPFSAVALCCIKSRKSDIPDDVYNQLHLDI